MSSKSKKSTKPAAKSNGNGKAHGRTFRIVKVESGALVGATTEGKITDSRLAKRYGITKPFKSWTEIEAAGWAEATRRFKAGQGKKVTLGAKKVA